MRQVDILIVDDSPADRASLRFAFEPVPAIRLHFAASGRGALDMLLPKDGARPLLRPHLCLVDIKMPGISGLDLLRAIKSDQSVADIPIIMYSGSDEQSDILAAYRGFASGYIIKPADAGGLQEMAAVLGRMCTSVLEFPAR
jgi:two-component system response regulator